MLAIFDADDNALQRVQTDIGRAELYERLVSDFADREINKSASYRSRSSTSQRDLAERELQRLALVALAMFARGRQAVSEEELNRDLSTLLPGDSEQSTGEDVALSPAQRATGWFFFIYKSEARSRDSRMRSYEFLHSTFAEFLVARLAVSAMQDLAAVREARRAA